ncbi:uncharacterized protein LOC129984672 [Argiope bruennichi]|uniref:uncharacterized protein LOC129984672 n=1 Tax=Argiope bruennichi TaxID=94029 RepID=UPI002494E3E8|nr:uncharacterized protein LOC129984672 [Argiope bruennichi]
MIKALLVTCLIGLAAAQYGHGGSGYGPDGVRNRYFILGHGRGPISTSIGSGIYGTSLGGSYGGYGSGSNGRSSYRPSHSSAYSAGGAEGYGHGGHAYVPAPAPVYAPAPPAPVHAPAPVYAPAPAPATHSYAPAPAVRSYAPAPRAYAPAAPSYAHSAPAVRSYSAPAVGHGLYGPAVSGGYSAPAASYGHHDDLAQPTPYDFGYDVHNEHGDQISRQEAGDGHGNVRGSYGYRDAYGIFRHVDYVADHYGFRANVRTNEPGTAPQDPADVRMHVEHGGYAGGHGY